VGSTAEWNDVARELRAAQNPWSHPAYARLFALADEDGRAALRSFTRDLGEDAVVDLIYGFVVDQLRPLIQADEPRAYFWRALVRRAISHKKKGGSRVEADPEQETPPSGPLDAAAEAQATRLDRAAAWACLSPREQAILAAIGDGEDREALAELFKTTRNNIDQIARRARQRLAELLK
jgi:DNA-directed RNA polymerase specialized sigma24 family protein